MATYCIVHTSKITVKRPIVSFSCFTYIPRSIQVSSHRNQLAGQIFFTNKYYIRKFPLALCKVGIENKNLCWLINSNSNYLYIGNNHLLLCHPVCSKLSQFLIKYSKIHIQKRCSNAGLQATCGQTHSFIWPVSYFEIKLTLSHSPSEETEEKEVKIFL